MEFKAGDRVVVTKSHRGSLGIKGTIVSVCINEPECEVRLDKPVKYFHKGKWIYKDNSCEDYVVSYNLDKREVELVGAYDVLSKCKRKNNFY